MARRWRGRLSRRDRLQEINNSFITAAILRGGTPEQMKIAEKFCTPLPEKRARIRRPVDNKPAVPLEKDVLAEVLKVLRLDPRVGYVWRQTSGTFMDGDRYIKAGPKGMPDVLGVLKGGRFFAIEVKRPGGKPEPHQQQRIDHFKQLGAISGYCWSAESALALLP